MPVASCPSEGLLPVVALPLMEWKQPVRHDSWLRNISPVRKWHCACVLALDDRPLYIHTAPWSEFSPWMPAMIVERFRNRDEDKSSSSVVSPWCTSTAARMAGYTARASIFIYRNKTTCTTPPQPVMPRFNPFNVLCQRQRPRSQKLGKRELGTSAALSPLQSLFATVGYLLAKTALHCHHDNQCSWRWAIF